MISSKERLEAESPRIVGFANADDGSLITIMYCERFPTHTDDWDRKRLCCPAFFIHVLDRSYIIWWNGALGTPDETGKTLLEACDRVSIDHLYVLLNRCAGRIV